MMWILRFEEDFSLNCGDMGNFINSKHHAEHVIGMVSIYSHNIPLKKAPLLSPFYNLVKMLEALGTGPRSLKFWHNGIRKPVYLTITISDSSPPANAQPTAGSALL